MADACAGCEVAGGVGAGPALTETAEKVRSKNGASGMSDIEGSEPDWQLAARVAASECGQRASFKDELGNVRRPHFIRSSTKCGFRNRESRAVGSFGFAFVKTTAQQIKR